MLERGATVLADERQGHSKTSAELREATLERTKLAQEVSDLRDRLAAEERQRQSQEEKHKHAHESLEHFRQSVKEQREQENRKHEQHAQFLQNEFRHLNQALTLKQHEATNAHQENARLLA